MSETLKDRDYSKSEKGHIKSLRLLWFCPAGCFSSFSPIFFIPCYHALWWWQPCLFEYFLFLSSRLFIREHTSPHQGQCRKVSEVPYNCNHHKNNLLFYKFSQCFCVMSGNRRYYTDVRELDETHPGTARFPCGCLFVPSDFIFLPTGVRELVNLLGILWAGVQTWASWKFKYTNIPLNKLN